ncbi:MAG TPA: hypothetical protein PKN80_00725 [bacterium]|uniref:Translocation protein TolB n=1 Tax=candidate division TA06 bacterium ADurb.Bin417 TaxID=1852828 RepID=A0A1V5MKD4_UNCT6|nr:MAG: hypothetical protein BWY73_00399 [candidate division TA06 bacterium ADurb.Bin417]HNQ34574.1 hypothetical protein [bacterium]HNS48166.1 hypothetical protein [bacterium]
MVKAISPEGRFCFFGYYDKCGWDESGEYHLFHEVDFQDRPPAAGDRARICLLETKTGRVEVLDETPAWNFQQGAMLQWLPDRRIIYNSVRGGDFISVIHDLKSGRRSELPRPVSAVSRDGRLALSLNYARLARWRPGYGYEGVADPFEHQKWPEADGVYLVDLETGGHRLVISLAGLLELRPEPETRDSFGWVNHTLFSPDGRRFIFLNRWKSGPKERHRTRIFTANPDGSGLHDLVETQLVSHFDWKDGRELLAWMEYGGKSGFWLIDDRTGHGRFLSENIQFLDGHCSYSPDRKFILLDTYPQAGQRSLKLFDTVRDREITTGEYFSPPEITGPIRCDLHPRWGRPPNLISFDSAHEGYRRVYAADIGEYLG